MGAPLERIRRRGGWGITALSVLTAGLLVLWLAAGAAWALQALQPPSRVAVGPVDLSSFGVEGVRLRMSYPERLAGPDARGGQGLILVSAVADSPDAIRPLTLAFPLPDDALLTVGGEGQPVSGRLEVVPGYPDALPHALYVAHADTQLRGGLLVARRVHVTPVLLAPGGAAGGTPLEPLAFTVRIPGRLGVALGGLLQDAWRPLLPYLLGGTMLLVAGWVVAYQVGRQRAELDERLRGQYARLLEEVRLQRWPAARHTIEDIRALEPTYRDVATLDVRVREEEYAHSRKEQRFQAGLEAYRGREWRAAAQILAEVEREDPWYRDVGFLQRTAALYADLQSRDRSRRVTAARQLGEVGDLVDWMPLLAALGDRSQQVADAAEHAFESAGMASFHSLLAGLADREEAVRSRAFRLLKGFGQEAREPLLGALRSSDPAVSASAARLLSGLGARRELAEALLWAREEHLEGIVAALVAEGLPSAPVLIDLALRVPPEREAVVLAAIAALKDQTDIGRPLDEALRATHDREARRVLERLMNLPAAPFVGGTDRRPSSSGPAEPALLGRTAEEEGAPVQPVEEEGEEGPPEQGGKARVADVAGWRATLFDRRPS